MGGLTADGSDDGSGGGSSSSDVKYKALVAEHEADRAAAIKAREERAVTQGRLEVIRREIERWRKEEEQAQAQLKADNVKVAAADARASKTNDRLNNSRR